MTVTFEEMNEKSVRANTKDGGWTQYLIVSCADIQPSSGKLGVKTPFPSHNFKLTSDEHQQQVRHVIEAAGYDLYVPDPSS